MTKDNIQIVPLAERIHILDILRGFAVFGILAVNITSFALPNHDFAQMNFSTEHWYDAFAFWFNAQFTEGKFYIIFSFLFGIGFSVQMARAEAKETNIISFYPCRLLILFGIGVLHSFLWWGDVLRLYAILGIVLLVLRGFSVKSLLILSFVCLLFSGVVAEFPSVFGGDKMPNADDVFSSIPFSLIHMGPTALALFLLGRVVGKIRFFENLSEKKSLLKKILVFGILISLGLKAVINFFAEENSGMGTILKTLSDISFSAFYIAVLCLFSLAPLSLKFIKPMANVGRMALTNYVMQTLICVAFFRFLNLERKIESSLLLVMTFIIYFVQMAYSSWWLGRFRYGLLEWIWRSLTYMKIQKLQL